MLRSEKGVVMVIATFFMVVLLLSAAIVVDVGQLYMVKSRLQSAADSAALAGSAALYETRDIAAAHSRSNDYISANLQAPYDYVPTANLSQYSYQVDIAKRVDFFFAPVIGIKNSTVQASATAQSNSIVSFNGAVPIGVEQQNFVFGQQYVLKNGGGSGSKGNYGALALGGNGANRYRENLKYGYDGEIKVGDSLTTEPGNMAGPTDQGISYRKSQCTNGCNYLTQIEANCPRVVIAPVVDSLNGNGRTTVDVVGFAAFFIEDTVDSKSKGQRDIVGRFLRWAAIGAAADSSDGAVSDYGPYTTALIK